MIDTAVPTPEESNYQSLKEKKKRNGCIAQSYIIDEIFSIRPADSELATLKKQFQPVDFLPILPTD